MSQARYKGDPTPQLAGAALILVDIQPDFMPGGALPVAEGDVILAGVNELLDAGCFAQVVATQDWHPSDHVSFASQHAGRAPFDVIPLYDHDQVLWPDHCVQGSPGAELHPDLRAEHIDMIIRKGTDPRVDSYSAFRNNWNAAGERPATGLAGHLRELAVDRVYICGLARDVCVKWTAEDAVDLGFDATVVWDLTRPVDTSTDAAVRDALTGTGVRLVHSADLRVTG